MFILFIFIYLIIRHIKMVKKYKILNINKI